MKTNSPINPPCKCKHSKSGHLDQALYYKSRGIVICLHCDCAEYRQDNLGLFAELYSHMADDEE